MGLTHFSILNALYPKFDFTVVEPNFTFRKILKNNIKAKFHSNDFNLKKGFDISLITTPPFAHNSLLKSCILRGDKKIFIEKPFGGYSNTYFPKEFNKTKIFIGYVLRFNPCIKWLKDNLNIDEIVSIDAQYLSNTIEKKPKGWRNGEFSGVLNEMGSHIIDLIQFLLNNKSFELITSEKKSLISDVDDIVKVKLKTKNKIAVSIYLNWVKKEIRKPVFEIIIKMKNGVKYTANQQQIKVLQKDGTLDSVISVVDLNEKVPFYLRGVDFTNQMIDLVDNTKDIATVAEAIEVNKLMKKIYNYENNIR